MSSLPAHYVPFAAVDPRRVVAFGDDSDKTYADLSRDVGRVAAALVALSSDSARSVASLPSTLAASTPAVSILCDNRYHFAVALLATWHARLVAALPHTRKAEGLTALDESTWVALTDSDEPPPALRRTLDVRRHATEPATERPLDLSLFSVSAETPLLGIYTSGTTGAPQAWTKTARQVLGEAETLARVFHVTADDRFLPTVPAQHIYGLLFGILVPLVAGASFAETTPSLPHAVIERASRRGATVLVSVPAQWQALGESAPCAVSTLRLGISSGARMELGTGQAVVRALGIPVIDVLGSTETGGIATKLGNTRDPYTALPGVEVLSDAGGRLLLRSPFVADPDELYRSEDRIELLPDGRFLHLGRSDRVVKIGAKRVTLEEIEQHALRLQGVLEARVVAVDVGGLRGTELWLAIVGPDSDPASVQGALGRVLDPVFVPRRIAVVPELVRGPTGKISEASLREIFLGNTLLPTERVFSGSAESRRFLGHFPEDPVYPGVAQLCDWVLPSVRAAYPDLGALRTLRRLKFHRPIRPETELQVRLERRGSQRILFELVAGDGEAVDPRQARVYSSGVLAFSEGR